MRDFFGHRFKTQALDLCLSLFCVYSLILSPVSQLNYSPGNILGRQGCSLKAQFVEFSCSGFRDFSLTSLLVYERCGMNWDIRKQGHINIVYSNTILKNMTLFTCNSWLLFWFKHYLLCSYRFFYLYKYKSIFLLTVNLIWLIDDFYCCT